MPSEESKRRKAHRRAERKAERSRRQLQRWINLPKDLYPYESHDRIHAGESAKETQAIIQKQQYLPWPIKKTRHPCRPWHPEDLWETGALKKALFNELYSCRAEGLVDLSSPRGKTKQDGGHNAEVCLHHILKCWYANIKNYDSAGPSFLVHVLEYSYNDHLSFSSLADEDKKTADTLLRAAHGRAFHVILGQMKRTVHTNSASQSEWLLEDLVHAGGKEVNVFPRLSGVDLLNEYFFEDQEADRYDGNDTTIWTRTVLIIVPNDFIDDFFYEDGSSYQTDERHVHDRENSQHGDDNDRDDEENEEFECKDEEAMLERAHELSQHRLALQEEQEQPDNESDVEVEDEHGNTYMMPASMFNEI
ncbi:hypothetical protein BKA63DRAFT_37546 [Paraphoma chrysanthemicola]|nr:hypothetical protein BKA63DRAFT_37546 [Paraphoma chrysanthemicola]